jgi:hypothetical protein
MASLNDNTKVDYNPTVTSIYLKSGNIDDFLLSLDNFIFDCDGVLWLSGHIIHGAPDTLQMLRRLVTNKPNTGLILI